MPEDPKVPEPKTDKQGRILDKQGRPLRDRQHRNYGTAAFRGDEGSPHPRKAKLEARQRAFDNDKAKAGRKRPGSTKK